jgi:hypothetical protein
MSEAGDKGFLFRAAGLCLLILAVWQLGEAGGILAAKEQLLGNREAMVRLAPFFLLGLFFLRGPLPARRSVARVAGFQFLNLGFLVAAAIYALAAVPLGVEFPGDGLGEVGVETTWPIRDRLQQVESKMSQLDRESAQGVDLQEGASDSRRREVEGRKQERLRQMEEWRVERAQLGAELEKRLKAIEELKGKEKGAMAVRLDRAQKGSGGVAILFIFLGLHGLLVGFIGRGVSGAGGFPVVSTSAGKVENSVPGALRPKRSVS